VATALCGVAVPKSYARLAGDDGAHAGWPDGRGWWALAAGLCMLAFILAVWMYFEPLARQAGLSESLAGTAIAVSLGAQVLGGSAATLLAGRLTWFATLTLSIVALIGIIALLATLPGPSAFLICAALFGFLWLFSTPFLAALAIDADPSRRAAALGSGAQLLGCSAGPLLASLAVTDADVRGSLALGVILALLCLAIVTGLRFTTRRSA
jgi:predicted MFS family arabinose efflux permease